MGTSIDLHAIYILIDKFKNMIPLTSYPKQIDQSEGQITGDHNGDHNGDNICNGDVNEVKNEVKNDINNNSQNSYDMFEIPYELTNVQRMHIHSYIKLSELFSESIKIRGSKNKKIIVHRTPDSKSMSSAMTKSEAPTPNDIKFFCRYMQIPLPTFELQYLDYFLDLYDGLYGTKQYWALFTAELGRIKHYKEVKEVMLKISTHIKENVEFKQLTQNMPRSSTNIIKKNVYDVVNIGKYFLSVDLRSANFNIVKHHCPNLFVDSNGNSLSWYDFVKQYTESDVIAKSNFFREIVFGNTGANNKLHILWEAWMDDVNAMVMKSNYAQITDSLVLKMKCGDECVYEFGQIDQANMNEVINYAMNLTNELQTNPSYHDKLHCRIFRLDRIGDDTIYFVKKYVFSNDWIKPCNMICNASELTLKDMIEFKTVPKIFIPQVIKWYMKMPIQKEDMLFTHEGRTAMFLEPLF